MEQTVLVFIPPAAINILLANLALGPATVDVTDFLEIHGNVFHNFFVLSNGYIIYYGCFPAVDIDCLPVDALVNSYCCTWLHKGHSSP